MTLEIKRHTNRKLRGALFSGGQGGFCFLSERNSCRIKNLEALFSCSREFLWGMFLMAYVSHFVLSLFVLIAVVGCGDKGGAVATDDEIKAHVEKHGDQFIDPSLPSPPLTY